MYQFNQIKDYLISIEFLNNNLYTVSLSLIVFISIYILMIIVKKIITSRLTNLVQKTKNQIDDIFLDSVVKIINSWKVFLSLLFAIKFLTLPQNIENIFNKIFIVIWTIIITIILQTLISCIIDEYFKSISKRLANSFTPFLKNMSKILLWLISIIFILSNLWYSISSLTAGLWISWIAIALAVKPTLESFFASISIFTDQPFQIWDMISFNWTSGTVKSIWLRTSVIKSFSGTEYVVPNTTLVSSEIENITKRVGQRKDFDIGVIYDTSHKKLEEWIEIIKNILKNQEGVLENNRVHFNAFGDSALIISTTYFIDSSLEFVKRLQISSTINFKIKKQFEKEKIEMAFPTQTVYVKK